MKLDIRIKHSEMIIELRECEHGAHDDHEPDSTFSTISVFTILSRSDNTFMISSLDELVDVYVALLSGTFKSFWPQSQRSMKSKLEAEVLNYYDHLSEEHLKVIRMYK